MGHIEMSQSMLEKNGYDHSIMGEPQLMMVQFVVALLLFTAYYAVFLVIDRNHPTLPKITIQSPPKAQTKIVPSKPSPSPNDESISSTLKIKECKNDKQEKEDKDQHIGVKKEQ